MKLNSGAIIAAFLCCVLLAGCTSLPVTSGQSQESCVIQGRLLFNGQLISRISKVSPAIWIDDKELKSISSAVIECDSGEYRISALAPGVYWVGATVDANKMNPNIYPGDYHGWEKVVASNSGPVDHDIVLSELIHLKKPQDNNGIIQGWENDSWQTIVRLKSPVMFSWGSVGNDVLYKYDVEIAATEPYRRFKPFMSSTTKRNWISLELPPSEDPEYYRFTITAEKMGVPIGKMMIHGKRAVIWEYRFQIKR